MKALFTLAILLVAFASCHKKKSSTATPFTGTITVDSPAVNDTVHGGSTFLITGTITGNVQMHGYHIVIYNQVDQSVVYETVSVDHETAYTLHETATHTLTATTPLRLLIEVAGDHEGSTITKEVLFAYTP